MTRRLLGPLAVAATASVLVAAWPVLGSERAGLLRPGADLVVLLTGVCAWVVSLAAAWFVVLLALVALEPYVGRDLAGSAGCPAWLRPTLLGLCGLAAVASLAGPAEASDHPAPPARTIVRGPADGLPVPDRTTATAPRRTATVVVAPGDSLWRIARRRLPTGASDVAVSDGWHRLYDRNRARIGADPDLVEPGTRLAVPSPLEEKP